jgi:hypothetical protein
VRLASARTAAPGDARQRLVRRHPVGCLPGDRGAAPRAGTA